MIFALVLLLFLTQFVLVILFVLRGQPRAVEDETKVNGISIVIPFHNEENRISKLLEVLNRQRYLDMPIELIFVDDHSTDQTATYIQKTLQIPHQLIHSSATKGKKWAIHEGVLNGRYEYILTLDADVEPEPYFFEHLLTCPASDLSILPVEMTGNTFFEDLATVEFKWLQLLTFGSKKPILCNGANLLFSKLAYLSSFRSRTDFDLASGDDAFLLQNFIHYKRKITRVNSPFLRVKTEAPHSFSELLKQRKRWIGKFNRMADRKSIAMLLILIAVQAAFITSFILCFFNALFFIPLALKFISETVAIYDEKTATKPSFFLVNLLHHFWYPIYLLLLLIPVSEETRWRSYQ